MSRLSELTRRQRNDDRNLNLLSESLLSKALKKSKPGNEKKFKVNLKEKFRDGQIASHRIPADSRLHAPNYRI